MAKSKKKLKFLKKQERNNLVNSINDEKKTLANNFIEDFYSRSKEYVKHFPVRKQMFEFALKLHSFVLITELMLDKMLEIFISFEKKTNKFSHLQSAWYNFTGNVLNFSTDLEFEVSFIVY